MWRWSVAVWGVLVVVGGLLTLALQGGQGGGAADPGSGTPDRPVSTRTYLPCPTPSKEDEKEEEEENTVVSCLLADG